MQVIGIVDLGLTANKYLRDSREEYFLAMVVILFILSTVFIIMALVGALSENDALIKVVSVSSPWLRILNPT